MRHNMAHPGYNIQHQILFDELHCLYSIASRNLGNINAANKSVNRNLGISRLRSYRNHIHTGYAVNIYSHDVLSCCNLQYRARTIRCR